MNISIQRIVRCQIRYKQLYSSTQRMSAVISSESDSNIGPLQKIMQTKLSAALHPIYLNIVNESFKHNVPKGSESHFSVTVVSELFTGKSLIERHRLVNSALSEELKDGIHALSIKAKTVDQWQEDSSLNSTPNCLGGSGK